MIGSRLTSKYSECDHLGSLAPKAKVANGRLLVPAFASLLCISPHPPATILGAAGWPLPPPPQVLSHPEAKAEAGSLAPRKDEAEMRSWGNPHANTV